MKNITAESIAHIMKGRLYIVPIIQQSFGTKKLLQLTGTAV
jgi:hypothetical protein